MRGSVRVTNAGGLLVANLEAGNALSFDPQAGAAGPTRVSGCLLRKDGKFLVVDQTTNVTLQVQGPGLDKEVGNRIEIAGAADPASPTVPGASQLINVQEVKRLGKGGCASTAKKVGTAGATGAAGGAAAGAPPRAGRCRRGNRRWNHRCRRGRCRRRRHRRRAGRRGHLLR